MANSFSTHTESYSHNVQIDDTLEAIVIVNVDTGKFVDCNAHAAAFFNIPEKALRNKNLLDLSPKLVFGQEASTFAKKHIDDALAGGNPIFDWIHLDDKGNALPCEVRLVRFPPYDQRFVKGFLIHKSEQRQKELFKLQHEERLQLALRAAQTGFSDFYPDEGIVYWDDRMHELMGLPITSKRDKFEYFNSILHPDDLPRVTKEIENLVNPSHTSNTFEWEYRIILNEKIAYMSVMGMLIRNEKGEIQRIINTNQDVTNRKLAEKALQESEKHFRALFEQPNIPFFIHDFQGKLFDANQNFLDTLGYTKEEFSDLTINDILKLDGKLEKALHIGMETLSKTGYAHIESIALKKSGDSFPIEINAHVIELDDKKLIYGSGRDLTDRKQVQLHLHYQATLLENLSEAVITTDNDFRVTSWNRGAEELYGWPSQEAIGKKLPDVVPTYYLEQTREEALTEFTTKGTWKGHVIQKNTKHENLYIQSSVANLTGPDGNQIGAIAVNHDITQRVRAEEELRESENRFRSVFNQQFQMMTILSLEGRILEINNLPLRMRGTTQEDYIGRYFWDSPGWKKLPDWQKIIKNQVLQAPTLEKPLRTVDLYQTPKGDFRYIDSAYSVVRDADNVLQFILVQGSDITERKLAEEKLIKTQKNLTEITERLQLSTKGARVGIWDWDFKKNILLWDETMFELYGIQNDNAPMSFDSWKKTIYPDDIEMITKEFEDDMQGVKEFDSEFRIIWPDQSIHFIKSLGTVQRDSAGNPVRIVGTNWDITKEREAEFQQDYAAQLELKNKELEQFAYVASHDLKEPIRSIKGFADLLRKRYQDKLDEDATVYLKFISEAASRMDNLVKALLDYSRIGRNKELTSVDCNEVIKEILHDLAAQISDSHATLFTDSLPVINGFETEIRMLFQNLISNAIKYRKEDTSPVINISVEKTLGHWKFCIADNGIGIDPIYKDKIFIIFQRLHTKADYEGTGIGLAHCKKIVGLHGGNIWCESEPAKGSKFYFKIPG